MYDNIKNTKKIALNGILGALAVICLLLASILPTNRLSFYALSSFFISVCIIESGMKVGWLFYASTSLLAMIIVPEKLKIVPYVLFFGIYGIIKYYIEKINKLVIEYILKFTFFNICAFIAVMTVSQLFGGEIIVKLPWWLIAIIFEIVFFIYDFIYTLVINYYRDRIRPKIKR